jgi:hypothetical protein
LSRAAVTKGGAVYEVDIAEPVLEYLRAMDGLSAAGFDELCRGIAADLGERADHYLRLYPRGHEALSFNYDYVLVDGANLFSFNFIVDAEPAPYGVVRVVYVEATPITLD